MLQYRVGYNSDIDFGDRVYGDDCDASDSEHSKVTAMMALASRVMMRVMLVTETTAKVTVMTY